MITPTKPNKTFVITVLVFASLLIDCAGQRVEQRPVLVHDTDESVSAEVPDQTGSVENEEQQEGTAPTAIEEPKPPIKDPTTEDEKNTTHKRVEPEPTEETQSAPVDESQDVVCETMESDEDYEGRPGWTDKYRAKKRVNELTTLIKKEKKKQKVESHQECESICELATAICYSSDEICDIADEFPDERVFKERCSWADRECRDAMDLCRSCRR